MKPNIIVFLTASTNKCNTTVALISNYIEENYANTTLSVTASHRPSISRRTTFPISLRKR